MVALHIIKQEEYYMEYMFHYVEPDGDEDLKCYEWRCQGIKRRFRKTKHHERAHQAGF